LRKVRAAVSSPAGRRGIWSTVNREEHAMRRADGGHLTAQDKATLTRQQNKISRSIDKDKHNAAVR